MLQVATSRFPLRCPSGLCSPGSPPQVRGRQSGHSGAPSAAQTGIRQGAPQGREVWPALGHRAGQGHPCVGYGAAPLLKPRRRGVQGPGAQGRGSTSASVYPFSLFSLLAIPFSPRSVSPSAPTAPQETSPTLLIFARWCVGRYTCPACLSSALHHGASTFVQSSF